MMQTNNSTGPRKLTSNLSEINVTPLVDVMLVLLIIFMVTAPMMQSEIRVTLPTAETADKPSSGGLILTVSKDHYIFLNSDKHPTNLFLLESKIKNHFVGKEKKIVFIKADKGVTYGYVIDVMDVLKKAGIEHVGMIVEKDDKKRK